MFVLPRNEIVRFQEYRQCVTILPEAFSSTKIENVITLASHADLHVYDPEGRHTGPNYETGMIDEDIPGATFRVLDSEGNEVPYDGYTPGEGLRQVVTLPSLTAGSYRIELVGTSSGPFELTVAVEEDGSILASEQHTGTIADGDHLVFHANAAAAGSNAVVTLDSEGQGAVLGASPAVLEVTTQSGGVGKAAITISEVSGEQGLVGVVCTCTEISGPDGKQIPASEVVFDQSAFDVPPGGEQVVHVSFLVPPDFEGIGLGTIRVWPMNGSAKSIIVKLTANPGTCTVTATPSPAEGGTITGAGTYTPGEEVTLVAQAKSDFIFVNWLEEGEGVSTDATYTFVAERDRALTAVFSSTAPDTCTITATASPAGGGTVSGAGTYALSEEVTLVAQAKPGYDFVSWIEDDQEVSTEATYAFVAEQDRVVVAVFVQTPATFGAVDTFVQVVLGNARYDRMTGVTSTFMAISNTSEATIGHPLRIVITSVSDPDATLVGSNGTTGDGYPYIDVTGELSDGQLRPGGSVGTWLHFENPLRQRLDFTYSIHGLIWEDGL